MDAAFLKDNLNYKAIALALALISAYPIYRAWDTRRKERLEFALNTAMDDLDILERRSSRGRLAGTAVIVGGR
jgi:ABC-type transport system involved in cytochrome c biogenesis permease subunit